VIRRALVARLDNAGDVLLAGPAVRAVAASPRVDEVWMLVSRQGEAAAALLPGVDRVLTWDCPWITSPPPDATREQLARLDGLLDEAAAGASLDVAVLLTSFHQSPLPLALQLRLAGVPRIVGASVDYAGALLDVRLRPGEDLDEDLPEPERALAIAAAGGFVPLPGDDGRLAVRIGAEDRASAQAVAPEAPYVVLHPGATASSRRWPAERYRETVRLLAARGIRPVVTGGAGERELTAAVAGGEGLDLAGRTGLGALAALIEGAEAVVTGNTGPAHLAAAVGTPVVSLFSPVVPAVRWAPYRVDHELLGDQHAPCRGTRAVECPVPGHPCLASVTATEVLEALERLVPLAERAGAAR
jgi:ADP-heptose:LPS heptosyltransferase